MSLVASYNNLTAAPLEFVTQLVGDGVLDASATFTRLSTGTYFDATPIMQTAAANVPRWDHDPLTGTALGLLIEQQDTNYVPHSNNFAAWGAASAGVAASAETFFGIPYSVISGFTTTGDGTVYIPLPVQTSVPLYASIAIRSGTSVQSKFGLNDVDGWSPSTSATIFGPASTAGTGPITVTGMSAADSLVEQVRTCSTGTALLLYPSSLNPSASGLTALFARAMVSLAPTSYIPTTGAAATRAEDNLTYLAPPVAGTILLDHDAAVAASLINTNSTDILTSQGAGKIAIAWDASGTSICYAGGAVTTGAAITWGTDYRLLKNANAHIKPNGGLLYFRKLSDAELQGATA